MNGSSSGGRVFFIAVLLLLAFGTGALVERSGWLPGSGHYAPPELGNTFDPFWEAWHLVEKYYVDREAVKPKRMTEYAIRGMLASLGDVGHTTYLTAEELEKLKSGLEGFFEGIGARMTIRNHRPTVIQTFPGSPARKAGLKPGDVLLAVDGKSVSNMPLERIVRMVRGPANTRVRLTVQRKGKSLPLTFRIARARVEVPDVAWHMLPGTGIAHVAIQSFGDQADEQLRAALKQARRQGAKGLILDVRGNPGGLKDQAVAVTSEFLKSGTVFIQQDRDGRRIEMPVKEGGVAPEIPNCVLIDEGTTSSSEIFAGAIQDYNRGKLVGTRTFGTGTVLRPFELSDGSAVLLAVAEWLTPKGRQIWHKGISPDIKVSLPEGAIILLPGDETELTPATLAKSEDKQLLRALRVLQEQMKPKERVQPAPPE
jgi:carboxyl-terminal processing protease